MTSRPRHSAIMAMILVQLMVNVVSKFSNCPTVGYANYEIFLY